MEQFSEEHSKLLFSKEWLSKVDGETSTPYLFKFVASTVDLTCSIMITDTKLVWAEVLDSNQIARRWRTCNGLPPLLTNVPEADDGEEEWRHAIIDVLNKLHTPGGIDDVDFEVVESRCSDFAFKIKYEKSLLEWKWRWETCFVGHKNSAEIISKHLVLPLISLSSMAFSLGDAVGQLSASDLEKEIDKVGRTGRRTFDTHIKNTVAKARIATSVRRLTAMFNSHDLPPVSLTNEIPALEVPSPPQPKVQTYALIPTKSRAISPDSINEPNLKETSSRPLSPPLASPVPPPNPSKPPPPPAEDSATESDDDEPVQKTHKPVVVAASVTASPPLRPSKSKSPPAPSKPIPRSKPPASDSDSSPPRPARKKPVSRPKPPASDSDSSPVRRPAKKSKVLPSDSSDSEGERKKHAARAKSGASTGVRQPLKRGGKRF